ncbi:MAG: exonuclease SbcCD subunit D [Chloroflexi bacterium]|nr:exonuclease SbcCD subunit D [Chloroflexota bacterium]MBV9893992.1 exonuclease SbcCD subunit D [Chloroflexota bacterium]
MAQLLRIAHIADTHIGMENYGRLNPETGLNQRLHDFLNSLDQAVDGAIEQQVDLVVFAGDIYKTRDPTPTHQREFARRIQRLTSHGIQAILVAGNHDVPMSAGRATSVDIFRALEVPGVTVARTIGTHRLETRSGPVQVIAFPWAVRSLVLAQPEYKNCTIAELNEAMIELTRARLRSEAEALDPRVPAIVVGHVHVFGARVGAERLLTMGSDPMYDLQTFDLPGIDYVALGHIHKHQVVHYAAPQMVYAGSIDRVDFGEQDEPKGWVYVEIPEKGRAEFDFRTVRARPFLTIDARVESENATEDVVRAIVRHANALNDAVVRLRLDIPPERFSELREDDIRAQLKSAYYVAPIERTNRQNPRNRWGSAGAEIQRAGPLEALALYLEYQKVESARREVLLRYARALMTEDEPGDIVRRSHLPLKPEDSVTTGADVSYPAARQ